MKFSFNVFLVPRIANRHGPAAAAVQFMPVDEASQDELERLERLNVLLKEKHIPIQNPYFFKPGRLLEAIQPRVPFRTNMSHHTAVWKHYNVRPAHGASKPECTKSLYRIYDGVHGDYVYTEAWVDELTADFSDKKTLRRIVGHAPLPR